MQDSLSRLFRNRSGAVIAGAIAALVAVILLIIYLHSYRSSVNSGTQPERVLVATRLIRERHLGHADRAAGACTRSRRSRRTS